MTYTITIQNADDNIIKLLKGFLKLMPNIHFSVKKSQDKGALSKENILHLEKQVRLINEGKAKFVTKTLDELEAMAK